MHLDFRCLPLVNILCSFPHRLYPSLENCCCVLFKMRSASVSRQQTATQFRAIHSFARPIITPCSHILQKNQKKVLCCLPGSQKQHGYWCESLSPESDLSASRTILGAADQDFQLRNSAAFEKNLKQARGEWFSMTPAFPKLRASWLTSGCPEATTTSRDSHPARWPWGSVHVQTSQRGPMRLLF